MGSRFVQTLLAAAVLLLAGSVFLALLVPFGVGIDGVVLALRGLALALACVLVAGGAAIVSRLGFRRD